MTHVGGGGRERAPPKRPMRAKLHRRQAWLDVEAFDLLRVRQNLRVGQLYGAEGERGRSGGMGERGMEEWEFV